MSGATPPIDLPGVDALADGFAAARARTLSLVDGLSDEQVESVHDPIMSPLVWDLAHIAAYEDLWIAHRLGGRDLLHPELAAMYDAFETPRAVRGSLPLLDHGGARDYLARVGERTDAVLRADTDPQLRTTLAELVIRHEHQHQETMLQALELARLPDAPHAVRNVTPAPERNGTAPLTGLESVAIPAGAVPLGATADGFAYDNERPRHAVELPAFRIGRAPVTNASFLSFSEGGGYRRREWWSREGWAWKEDYDITRPAGWTDDGRRRRLDGAVPLDPHAPVVHVSWFEADAFARAHGARLPTEAEWEKAATWDQEAGARREPETEHATLDWRWLEPRAADPRGASPSGCLAMLGDVWEWTASPFGGYPGFSPYPYREYSEVFFGGRYRVLRGGSWATAARVANATFRNWDLPQRRQIFAGFRLAWDAD